MKPPAINKTLALSIALLVVAVSVLGLLVPSFYSGRNNAITTFEIAGQDAVSLIVGILLLCSALSLSKGGVFPTLVAGCLVYSAYTYSYFSFGLLASKTYIAYPAIASLSFYSLLRTLSASERGESPSPRPGAKAVSAYLIIVVALVGSLDLKDLIGKTILGGKGLDPKDAFYILDLAFLFPAMVLAAALNARGSRIGSFFAGAFLVKAIALMPALIVSDCLLFANTGAFADLGFDCIALAVLVSAIFFFTVHMRRSRPAAERAGVKDA
jgi:hypothetical protein